MRKDCGHKLLEDQCVECWKRRCDFLIAENDRLGTERDKFGKRMSEISRLNAEVEDNKRHSFCSCHEEIDDIQKDRNTWKSKAEKMVEAVKVLLGIVPRLYVTEIKQAKAALEEIGND